MFYFFDFKIQTVCQNRNNNGDETFPFSHRIYRTHYVTMITANSSDFLSLSAHRSSGYKHRFI